MSTPKTPRERYDDVIRRLEDRGITLVLLLGNDDMVRSECLAEYVQTAERAGTPDKWAGASAGGATWFGGGLVYRADRTPVERLWFSFPHKNPAVAEAVVDAFEAEGFDTSWNGTPGRCVEVTLRTAAVAART